MRLIIRTALLLAPFLTLPAHAQVFKCTDAAGSVLYTNNKNEGRGCTPLKTDLPVSSVPAPPKRQAATPGSNGSAATSTGGFPRVTPDTQKARDDTRRQILASELATEEKALAEARAALTEQESIRLGDEKNYQKALDRMQPYKDKVELHERNIEALRKEMQSIK